MSDLHRVPHTAKETNEEIDKPDPIADEAFDRWHAGANTQPEPSISHRAEGDRKTRSLSTVLVYCSLALLAAMLGFWGAYVTTTLAELQNGQTAAAERDAAITERLDSVDPCVPGSQCYNRLQEESLGNMAELIRKESARNLAIAVAVQYCAQDGISRTVAQLRECALVQPIID